MKWYWWVFWIVVALFIINQPLHAAHVANHLWSGVTHAASSAATFVSSI